MKIIILSTTIFMLFSACKQPKIDRRTLDKESAQIEFNKVMTDKHIHNALDGKSAIIKNDSDAMKISETILFSIYGKENIVEQKPYSIYKFGDYYFISGSIPKESIGGTFRIIINSINSQVMNISHGK